MPIVPERADFMSHVMWRLAVKRTAKVIDKEAQKVIARNNAIAVLARHIINDFHKSNYDAYFNYLQNHEAEQAQREAQCRRRIRVKNAGEMFTLNEWLELCDRHDNCCARCGKQEKLTVDHIQPVSKGGTNDIGNICPLCRSCNSHKGTDNTDYRR